MKTYSRKEDGRQFVKRKLNLQKLSKQQLTFNGVLIFRVLTNRSFLLAIPLFTKLALLKT